MLKFVRSRQKRKDKDMDEEESATENGSSDVQSPSDSDLDSEAEEDDDVKSSALAASTILEQPLVPDEENEDMTLCLICPRKLLKNDKMAEVHANSLSHQRRVKRFQMCTNELESETNEHPTLNAVLYRMGITVANYDTKQSNPPKTARNHNVANIGKPKVSRREKKLARKARRQFSGGPAATPDASTEDRQKTVGCQSETAKLSSKRKEPNASQHRSTDDQGMHGALHKRRSERDGGEPAPRKKRKVVQGAQ